MSEARDSLNAACVQRILRSGDPRGDDLRNAGEWVAEIRSRLSHIRGEIEDVGRIESAYRDDRVCEKVAGTLTLCLSALYGLEHGERSFEARAERADALWADVATNPDAYKIEDGSTWDWRPWGIFKRGGR